MNFSSCNAQKLKAGCIDAKMIHESNDKKAVRTFPLSDPEHSFADC